VLNELVIAATSPDDSRLTSLNYLYFCLRDHLTFDFVTEVIWPSTSKVYISDKHPIANVLLGDDMKARVGADSDYAETPISVTWLMTLSNVVRWGRKNVRRDCTCYGGSKFRAGHLADELGFDIILVLANPNNQDASKCICETGDIFQRVVVPNFFEVVPVAFPWLRSGEVGNG
jgi:hypothetical protein